MQLFAADDFSRLDLSLLWGLVKHVHFYFLSIQFLTCSALLRNVFWCGMSSIFFAYNIFKKSNGITLVLVMKAYFRVGGVSFHKYIGLG